MASTEPRPSTLAPPAPVQSIFTLRPKAVTLKPGAEPQPAPVATPRTRFLVAVLALAGLGLLGWQVGKPSEPGPQRALPAVFVNGAPKEKVTDQGKPERWAAAPVKVTLDASLEQLGPGATAAVQAGFGAWLDTDATLPGLSFDTTSGKKALLEPDGENTVMFAPIEIDGHKKDVALTISFVDEETGRILESDIVINATKPFGLLGGAESAPGGEHDPHDDDDLDSNDVPGCGARYDLQNVVAHEVGHFFGLGEDQDDPATTMFFKTGKCEIRKRDLEPPDRSVMVHLYQQPAPESAAADRGGGCGGASIANRAAPREQLVLFGLALFAWARRRRR